MKSLDPQILFAIETVNDEGKPMRLVVTQPGPDLVQIRFAEGDAAPIVAQLSATQASALAVEIVAANVDALGKLAEKLPQSLGLALGAALVAPHAARAVLRKAFGNAGPEAAN